MIFSIMALSLTMISELMLKTTLKPLLAFLRSNHQHREGTQRVKPCNLSSDTFFPSLEKLFIYPEHAEFSVEVGRLAIH